MPVDSWYWYWCGAVRRLRFFWSNHARACDTRRRTRRRTASEGHVCNRPNHTSGERIERAMERTCGIGSRIGSSSGRSRFWWDWEQQSRRSYERWLDCRLLGEEGFLELDCLLPDLDPDDELLLLPR